MKPRYGAWSQLASRLCAPLAALMLFAYPLAAFAQGHDDDEKPVPLDPVTQRAQLLTFGVIAALVIAFVVFYYVRRWQLMHSSNFQEGFEQDED